MKDLAIGPKKKIDMFPPYRPGELFFPLTRAEGNSTIPFFYETLLTLLLFSTSTYSFGMLIHFSHISPLFFTVGPRGWFIYFVVIKKWVSQKVQDDVVFWNLVIFKWSWSKKIEGALPGDLQVMDRVRENPEFTNHGPKIQKFTEHGARNGQITATTISEIHGSR
jgi:hypothetical protein